MKSNVVGHTPKEFWDKRFSASDYVYGKEPNSFFKSVIDRLPAGKVLIPGAGEGRDAVYAATKGWQVYCVDMSEAGKVKAMQLSEEMNVLVQYDVLDISDALYTENSFDLVAAIFFHLPNYNRKKFYADAVRWLKPGGTFALEAFTPKQLNYTSGGPQEVELLVSEKQLQEEVSGVDVVLLEEQEVALNEGKYHQGLASVVDFIGVKNKIE